MKKTITSRKFFILAFLALLGISFAPSVFLISPKVSGKDVLAINTASNIAFKHHLPFEFKSK